MIAKQKHPAFHIAFLRGRIHEVHILGCHTHRNSTYSSERQSPRGEKTMRKAEGRNDRIALNLARENS
jgi:hypothetical protein